jgi:hypothetical protein
LLWEQIDLNGNNCVDACEEKTMLCDDGNECTMDVCVAGTCRADVDSLYGMPCSGGGACDWCAEGECAAHGCSAAVATGGAHTCALLDDGQVNCWGYNVFGQLGLGDTVRFLDEIPRSRLAEEYVNADCFCLPSVQEGFGIVFLEAMAAGLPIVACRAAAVHEVVPDGVAGLLVEPRDPDRLAAALEELLTDTGRRKEYGEAGRRRAAEFDAPRVAERFLEAVTPS